ncbi:Endoribonuclease L-PSP [Helicobacter bizzozeronii CCUG 35545]|nr:Endoribonuclease L-PSP [Helicobacter bizzozeronii CCUG 35545]
MKAIHSEHAPKAIGPYSQAIESHHLVFVSGQLGINPQNGEFAGEDIQAQTKQAMENNQSHFARGGFRHACHCEKHHFA